MISDEVRDFAEKKGSIFMIAPPTEEQRIRNERTEGVGERITEALKALFGRWPSRG